MYLEDGEETEVPVWCSQDANRDDGVRKGMISRTTTLPFVDLVSLSLSIDNGLANK